MPSPARRGWPDEPRGLHLPERALAPPYLKLAAAAERLAPALEEAERSKPSYADFLDGLLGAEVEATEARRLERRLRLAGFPHRKTLEEFDFSAQPSLEPAG